MRKLALALLSSAALLVAGVPQAADSPAKAPMAPAVAPAFSWTGFYMGANAGYGWGEPPVFCCLRSTSRSMAGSPVNYQFADSPFVIGFEADGYRQPRHPGVDP